jgi:hypothetical protein
MGWMRSIVTGFSVGVMLGASGYYAAVTGNAASIALLLPSDASARGRVTPSVANYEAEPVNDGMLSKASLTISDEPGGYILDFALRMLKWRQNGTAVRFTGRCDSACTLYLALPYEQTCVAKSASFRFHAPTAGSGKASEVARHYMLSTYPGWVKSWIDAMGGLTGELITMNFEYARRHMRVCQNEVRSTTRQAQQDIGP